MDGLVGYATITVNATRRRVLLPCRRSLQLLPTLGTAAQNDVEPSIVTFNQLRIGNRQQWLTSICHNEALRVIASSLHGFLLGNGTHRILRATGIAPGALRFVLEDMAHVACFDRGRANRTSEQQSDTASLQRLCCTRRRTSQAYHRLLCRLDPHLHHLRYSN